MQEDELRERILRDYKVSKARVTISQNMYSNDTVSPIEFNNQDVVEIGIDDLITLIKRYSKDYADRVIDINIPFLNLNDGSSNKKKDAYNKGQQHMMNRLKAEQRKRNQEGSK